MSSAAFLILAMAFLWSPQATSVCLDSQWVLVMSVDHSQAVLQLLNFNLNETLTSKWNPILSHFKHWSILKYKNSNASEYSKFFSNIVRKGLDHAKRIILDQKEREKTPVFFYVTESFQKPYNDTRDLLFQTVRNVLADSNFDTFTLQTEMPTVKAVTPEEQAKLSWLGLNSVQSNFKTQTANEDFGYIDIGYHSTKISFRPDSFDSLTEAEVDSASLWYHGPLSNETGPGVYTHTFPTGMVGVIMHYLGAHEECYENLQCSTENNYSSVCINPSFKKTFHIEPYTITVSGLELNETEDRYQLCLDVARELLSLDEELEDNQTISQLVNEKRPMFFSNGLLVQLAHSLSPSRFRWINREGVRGRCWGYEVTLREYEDAARKTCQKLSPGYYRLSPYSCILATYTVSLMKDKYKLPPETIFHFCDWQVTENGPNHGNVIEFNWPIGVAQLAAMNIVQNRK